MSVLKEEYHRQSQKIDDGLHVTSCGVNLLFWVDDFELQRIGRARVIQLFEYYKSLDFPYWYRAGTSNDPLPQRFVSV